MAVAVVDNDRLRVGAMSHEPDPRTGSPWLGSFRRRSPDLLVLRDVAAAIDDRGRVVDDTDGGAHGPVPSLVVPHTGQRPSDASYHWRQVWQRVALNGPGGPW